MTRSSLNTKLRLIYAVLFAVLALSLVTKLGAHISLVGDFGLTKLFADIYDYMKDMALIFITVIAAYLANVFQKRSSFVASLEREWRGIVQTKTELYKFTEMERPTTEAYLDAYCRISATIDNMRICYKNVGETNSFIGLYPYEPLHDMRRLLMTLDPQRHETICDGHRRRVRDGILQSFAALRENFLEELDLEQPAHPLLVSGGRRLKKSGAPKWAYRQQKRQNNGQLRAAKNGNKGREDVNALIGQLKRREKQGEEGTGGKPGHGAVVKTTVAAADAASAQRPQPAPELPSSCKAAAKPDGAAEPQSLPA